MEHTLSCNNLKCRRQLSERALVTTCSHIFCLDCARQLGVMSHDQGSRAHCPACKSELPNADDAVVTNLRPSEDYKTSVLSGLSPSVIMECAGRALSFWAYQTTQDIHYHQYLYRTAAEKNSDLNAHFTRAMNDAGSQIEMLQNKLSATSSEQEVLRRKNEDLAQAYRDKSRKLHQTQELYDKVKRKAEMGHIQQAAAEAVDATLQDATQHTIKASEGTQHTRGFDLGQHAERGTRAYQFDPTGGINTGPPRMNHAQLGEEPRWPRPGLSHRTASPIPMAGMMRQRLGPTAHPGSPSTKGFETSSAYGRNVSRPMEMGVPAFTSNRSALSGIGLTSGLRVSQPTGISGLDSSARHF